MERFFLAESVALIGVSNSPGNLGRVMAYNMLEFRFQGSMYLVGQKGGAFLGHRIYPSVLDIPDRVDLAALLVPASTVPRILEQCGEKGIRRVVVQSAGFRELGKDRVELEEKVQSVLKRYGMRMIGPNCIGIMNRGTGLAVPFMPFKAEAPLGRVAVISQSGGVGAVLINSLAAESIGFSKFASIGNKLNVNEADLIEYLSGDDETDAIFCYLEGIAEGRRLMEIAARSPKPIVIHKSNKGASGSVIARSHSASLSTDDRIVEGAFRQCGILRAREQRDALEKLKAFALPAMGGNRLAIISRSGGHAVMAADAAEDFGFQLPSFPAEMLKLVEEGSRAKVIQLHNPLDLGDLYQLPLYGTLAEKALENEGFDGLLFIHNYQGIFDAQDSRELIAGLGKLMDQYKKPVALCVFTMSAELEHNRKTCGFPIFTDPREAVRALATARDWRLRRPLAFSKVRPEGIDMPLAQRELDSVPEGSIPPEVLGRVLSAYGIGHVEWEKAESEEQAVSAAKRLGFPVALKTANAQIIHKSEAGAVHLNLGDEAAVRQSSESLLRMGPAVLVQKMAGPGLEWLVGGRRDAQFGPVLVVGLGGIYVEVFKETGIRVGPIGVEEAGRLLAESRGAALLAGVRGEPPLDREALVETMVRVSWLLADFPAIRELDLNPVRVFQKGCLALDWRAVKEL